MILLQRLLGALVVVVLAATAVFVASLLFAVIAIVALLLWVWLLWRTRHLPRRPPAGAAGDVIEGEYRVERDTRRIDDEVR